MKNSNVNVIISDSELDKLIFDQATNLANAEISRAKIWEAFRESFDRNPKALNQFAIRIGEAMARYLSDGSLATVEAWQEAEDEPDLVDWKTFRTMSTEYNSIWLANHATKKWVAEKTGGTTYTLGRLTMSKILAGESYTAKLFEKKAKTPKLETATGKKASQPAAEGAKITTPESGATALETMTGDIHSAKAALLEALKAFPELTMQKSVIQAFHAASKKADKLSAAKKASRKKAA